MLHFFQRINIYRIELKKLTNLNLLYYNAALFSTNQYLYRIRIKEIKTNKIIVL
jgi:hypothetical protein